VAIWSSRYTIDQSIALRGVTSKRIAEKPPWWIPSARLSLATVWRARQNTSVHMHTHMALVALILQVRNNFVHIRWLHTSTSTCTHIFSDFLPNWPMQILHSCHRRRPRGMRNYSSCNATSIRSYLWTRITRCLDGRRYCFVSRNRTLACFLCLLTVMLQLQPDASLRCSLSTAGCIIDPGRFQLLHQRLAPICYQLAIHNGTNLAWERSNDARQQVSRFPSSGAPAHRGVRPWIRHGGCVLFPI
jgi:hypothetical protein